jgi:hypothetical protein
MRQNSPARAAAAAVVILSACGGGSSPSTTPTPASPQVGGIYDVTVRLLENECAGTPTVQAQPTSVTHAPGATAFTLTHGGLQVTGSVSRDGAFTTQSVAVQDPLGPATLAIAGRFATTGLEATVTVTVTPPAPAASCRYRVGWTGTKQGAPNRLG